MEQQKLKPIIEALLCAADGPLTVNHLYDLFTGDLDQPVKDDIRKVLHELVDEYQAKGM
ncbi:MAG: SMC-Scp complex subunit ScpB, partial [Gammaproteobacteria bacterium]|nr:SMC-Scp complex subunit ScpB [Gammaproteobacteria bacterium]